MIDIVDDFGRRRSATCFCRRPLPAPPLPSARCLPAMFLLAAVAAMPCTLLLSRLFYRYAADTAPPLLLLFAVKIWRKVTVRGGTEAGEREKRVMRKKKECDILYGIRGVAIHARERDMPRRSLRDVAARCLPILPAALLRHSLSLGHRHHPPSSPSHLRI